MLGDLVKLPWVLLRVLRNTFTSWIEVRSPAVTEALTSTVRDKGIRVLLSQLWSLAIIFVVFFNFVLVA